MVNTCVVAFCKTGYTKRENKRDIVPEKFPLFKFPVKYQELNQKWIKFVNRKYWVLPKHRGVSSEHLKTNFLKLDVLSRELLPYRGEKVCVSQ